jgi:glutamate-5-semialdehyde dehydrogenase
MHMTTQDILTRAHALRPQAAALTGEARNAALLAMADALEAGQEAILAANARDTAAARGRISDVMIDRLTLSPARIAAMAEGIRQVAALPDPVDALLDSVPRPNGLTVEKRAVPMGVIAIIYESRPNVTADAAALCLKDGVQPDNLDYGELRDALTKGGAYL